MSEQQPLLCSENGNGVQEDKNTLSIWRGSLADYLESHRFHKTVLSLICIDAACVLADLIYILLSNECRALESAYPSWLLALSYISLAITTLFLLEIPLTLWAIGFEYYNPFGDTPHSTLHIFDAVVIVSTFTLEAVLRGKEREIAGLLIILRLWRIVKLIGGVAAGASALQASDVQRIEDLETELQAVRAALATALDENQKLHARFIQPGI